MMFITLGLVCFISTIHALHESYEADDHANVTLPCNYTLHGLSYLNYEFPFKRYWTIPNGTVIPDTFLGNDQFKLVKPTNYDFSLNIASIDEPDFGVYHCVILWNYFDYTIDIIQIGLNVEEPFYRRQYEDFKSNVIIGGVITGLVFAAFVVGCIVCSCRYSRQSQNENISHDFEHQKSHSKPVYGYDMNRGFEPSIYGGRKEEANPEVYAHRDVRAQSHDLRRGDDSATQTAHF